MGLIGPAEKHRKGDIIARWPGHQGAEECYYLVQRPLDEEYRGGGMPEGVGCWMAEELPEYLFEPECHRCWHLLFDEPPALRMLAVFL